MARHSQQVVSTGRRARHATVERRRRAPKRAPPPPGEAHRRRPCAASTLARIATDFRANPYTEGTNPFCRLPLLALFYWSETLYLGGLLRTKVRADTSLRPAFFSRCAKTRTPGTVGALSGLCHIALVQISMARTVQSSRKDNSSLAKRNGPQAERRYRLLLRARRGNCATCQVPEFKPDSLSRGRRRRKPCSAPALSRVRFYLRID